MTVKVGGQAIRTTDEHPFYVQDKGWTQASLLAPGDLLRSHDGRWLPLESIESHGEVATVYNLRIAEYHTYFVGAPAWGFSVWSHNTACGSRAFAESTESSGISRPSGSGWQAAHAAPTGAFSNRNPVARVALGEARAILARAGIKLNDFKKNGFWAKVGHLGTHRNAHFIRLRDVLRDAELNGNVPTVFEGILKQLRSGHNPLL